MPQTGTTSCLASIVFPKNYKAQQFSETFKKYIGRVQDGMAILEGVHAEVSYSYTSL